VKPVIILPAHNIDAVKALYNPSASEVPTQYTVRMKCVRETSGSSSSGHNNDELRVLLSCS
jgi:hypothetical protein